VRLYLQTSGNLPAAELPESGTDATVLPGFFAAALPPAPSQRPSAGPAANTVCQRRCHRGGVPQATLKEQTLLVDLRQGRSEAPERGCQHVNFLFAGRPNANMSPADPTLTWNKFPGKVVRAGNKWPANSPVEPAAQVAEPVRQRV